MINADTKRHIDSARQVLVGVVPNPTSQIDQITNALIYKFMDDMDQSAIKAGGDPSFFIGDLEPYAWTKIMSDRLGHQERMNLYAEALVKFSQAKQLPPLFRDIFKSAYLPYRSPETLGLFLKEISYFDYAHPEDLGDAYEYLLSIMSSQGDAGQFRTPRNIIDFIVDVVNPTKDDKVLDPACGTGGFLVSSYKHIIEQHDGKDDPEHKEKPLTPEQRKKLFTNFEGYDIDPSMVRIAQVNMYLHQFKNPQVSQYDTLTQEENWGEKYDVILANPPFMSPQGGIRPHNKFSLPSNRSEVLFVDYIMNHLKPKGRAGIIVPEGIIFKSDTATKALRKALVEDGLYAVVSLPAGVFNPYAGVKTSILLFDNEHAKQSDELLFVKVENDGFDLGAQRRPISKNDLPEALMVLNAWREGKKVESNISKWVPRKTIAETTDFNLSASRYVDGPDHSNIQWDMVFLGDILEYEQPTPYIVNSVEYDDSYKTPVLTAGKSFILGYTNETEGIFTETLPVIIFDDFTTATKLVDFPFKVKSSAMKILKVDRSKADIRYVYYAMQNIDFVPAEHKRYWISQYSKIKIPLPPLKVQQQIVSELDSYQKIIDGARQIVCNWKPSFVIDAEWPMTKLGEVCDTTSGGTPLKSVSEYYEGGTIPWLRSGEVSQGYIDKSELYITKAGLDNSSAKIFPSNTVLVAMYGATAGQVGILKFESSTNQAVCGILPSDRFIPEFIYYVLLGMKDVMVRQAGGGAQPNISQTIIKDLVIPTPPLTTQKQIVDTIEAERAHVESARILVDLYTKKTQSTIAKLWSE